MDCLLGQKKVAIGGGSTVTTVIINLFIKLMSLHL